MADLHYKIYGKGDPIVFLHGFLGNSAVWKDFINFFQGTYQVITIDLPGHGASPIKEETIEMHAIAIQLEEILKHEKIDEAHFIGHSMGGYVALAYAKQFTDKVKGLTLFNSTARGDNEQKKADRLKAVRVFDMNPSIFINEAIKNLFYTENLEKFPNEVEELTLMAKGTSIEGAQSSLRGMRIREDLVDWLQEQKFPVHYIAGQHDNTVPYQSILDQLPERAKLTTLENSGHMGFVEEKDKCIQTIKEFISQSN